MSQEFERFDGEKVEVDCCVCCYCKNYFWTRTDHNAIERPMFCCWCGEKFSGVRECGDDEIKDAQT